MLLSAEAVAAWVFAVPPAPSKPPTVLTQPTISLLATSMKKVSPEPTLARTTWLGFEPVWLASTIWGFLGALQPASAAASARSIISTSASLAFSEISAPSHMYRSPPWPSSPVAAWSTAQTSKVGSGIAVAVGGGADVAVGSAAAEHETSIVVKATSAKNIKNLLFIFLLLLRFLDH